MVYKIAVRYQGDSGYVGEIEAERYTREVRLALLALVTRLMNLHGFAWQIIDNDGNTMDSYND